MGWSFKKTLKGITSNPLRAAAAVGTFGGSEAINAATGGKLLDGGGLSDMLLGKKSKDINPDAIANQLRETQAKGLTDLNSALDTPAEDIVNQQAQVQKNSLVSGAQDARRNAQKLIAQRGLGNSSLGLGALKGIDRGLSSDTAAVNAGVPGQIRDTAINNAQQRIQAGGINTSGMNFNTIQGSRTGGVLGYASALAPIAGTIAGGMFGGPMGAAAGAQAGQGLASLGKQAQGTQGASVYNPNRYSMGNYTL